MSAPIHSDFKKAASSLNNGLELSAGILGQGTPVQFMQLNTVSSVTSTAGKVFMVAGGLLDFVESMNAPLKALEADLKKMKVLDEMRPKRQFEQVHGPIPALLFDSQKTLPQAEHDFMNAHSTGADKLRATVDTIVQEAIAKH